MLRLAWILIVAFVLAGLVAWLATQPGELVAVWRGYRIETSAAAALVGTVLLLALAVLVPLAIVRLARGPARFRAGRAAHRRDQGYAALTEGLVAVAAGEPRDARRHARTARSRLGEGPLVLLLSAQAAQLEGDSEAAERAFRAMLGRPETEFLGLRGLIVQTLRRGDRSAALSFLDRARRLRPRGPWILASEFELACAAGEWPRAEALLADQVAARQLDDAAVRRRRTILWTARAQAAEQAGNLQEAREHAERANRLDPGFAPAARVLARSLAQAGDTKKARKILAAAWARSPHPDLASALWSLVPNETPAERLEHTRKLIAGAPQARESRLALAEAAIAAGALADARAALDALASEPTQRVCTLQALLARAEGDEAQAWDWLARAPHAPRDPVWLCRTCSSEAPDWSAACPSCGGFDALDWAAPKSAAPAIGALRPDLIPPAPALAESARPSPAKPALPDPASSAGRSAQAAAADSRAPDLPRPPDDPGLENEFGVPARMP